MRATAASAPTPELIGENLLAIALTMSDMNSESPLKSAPIVPNNVCAVYVGISSC